MYKPHTVKVPTDRTRIVVIGANLSEVGAFAIERRMIRWYGRKDTGTGILRNKTDGGEGATGLVQTEEHRRKNSLGNKGRKQPPRTAEQRENYRQASLRAWENNPELRIRQSERNKGQVVSIETRHKISIAGKGKRHTEESKNKMKETRATQVYSDESKAKMSQSGKGLRHWTNGVQNTRSRECPGPEWVRGRTAHYIHRQSISQLNNNIKNHPLLQTEEDLIAFKTMIVSLVGAPKEIHSQYGISTDSIRIWRSCITPS